MVTRGHLATERARLQGSADDAKRQRENENKLAAENLALRKDNVLKARDLEDTGGKLQQLSEQNAELTRQRDMAKDQMRILMHKLEISLGIEGLDMAQLANVARSNMKFAGAIETLAKNINAVSSLTSGNSASQQQQQQLSPTAQQQEQALSLAATLPRNQSLPTAHRSGSNHAGAAPGSGLSASQRPSSAQWDSSGQFDRDAPSRSRPEDKRNTSTHAAGAAGAARGRAQTSNSGGGFAQQAELDEQQDDEIA